MPETPTDHDVRKRHRRTFWLTLLLGTPPAVLATMTAAGLAWKLWLSAAVVGAVTDAVAQDLERTVEAAVAKHVEPVTAGLKASIQSQIADLEDDIARLEFRQREAQRPNAAADWTREDEVELTTKRRRLAQQQMALDAIEAAE